MRINWISRIAKTLFALGIVGTSAAVAAPLGTNLVLNSGFESVTGDQANVWTGQLGTWAYSANYTGAALAGSGSRYWHIDPGSDTRILIKAHRSEIEIGDRGSTGRIDGELLGHGKAAACGDLEFAGVAVVDAQGKLSRWRGTGAELDKRIVDSGGGGDGLDDISRGSSVDFELRSRSGSAYADVSTRRRQQDISSSTRTASGATEQCDIGTINIRGSAIASRQINRTSRVTSITITGRQNNRSTRS